MCSSQLSSPLAAPVTLACLRSAHALLIVEIEHNKQPGLVALVIKSCSYEIL